MLSRQQEIREILHQCEEKFSQIGVNEIFGSRALDIHTLRIAILQFIKALNNFDINQEAENNDTILFNQAEIFIETLKEIPHLESETQSFVRLAKQVINICIRRRKWEHLFEEMQDPCTDQFILCFDDDVKKSGMALKRKWQRLHKGSCNLLDTNDIQHMLDGKIKFLLDKENKTKIYILAHSLDFLEQNYVLNSYGFPPKQTKLHYKKLAEMLVSLMGSNKNVIINLVVCCAGRGVNDQPYTYQYKSFAAKLHAYLLKKLNGNNIPVIARTHNVIIDHDYGVKSTRDLKYKPSEVQENKIQINKIQKQSGSKVIFTTNYQNEQVVADAYAIRWKGKVIKAVTFLHQNTSLSMPKQLLNKWLREFKGQSPKFIFEYMQAELHYLNSVYNKTLQSSFIELINFQPGTSIGKIQTMEIIKQLIQEGESILKNAAPTKKFSSRTK